MKRFLKSIGHFVMISSLTFPAFAEITSYSTMDSVNAKMQRILKGYYGNEVLITMKVEHTLMGPKHPALDGSSIRKQHAKIEEVTGYLNPAQKDVLKTLSIQDVPWMLIDPATPKYVGLYQTQGFKVIALSTALTGEIGHEDRMEVYVAKELNKLGYNFSKSFPLFNDISFEDMPEYLGHNPAFYQGVLLTNGSQQQGEVLIHFLQKSSFTPLVVIAVDADKQSLQAIEKSLKAYNPKIKFVGIVYLGGKSYAAGQISKNDFSNFWENLAQKAKQETASLLGEDTPEGEE